MTTTAFRRLAAGLLAGAVLVLAACDGGDGEPDATATPELTATPESTIVTSDDGKLILTIPNGAMPEGTNVTATAVSLSELPPELQQLSGARDGYRLEPDGLQFSMPVTVTLTLDRSDLPDEPANGMSAYGMVVSPSGGGREILTGLSTTASLTQPEVVIVGQLTHFSFLGTTRSSLAVELDPAPREQPTGGTFTSAARARNQNQDTVRLEEPLGAFEASGQVSLAPGSEPFIGEEQVDELNGDGWERGSTFQCADDPGPGTYGVAARAVSVAQLEGQEPIRTELRVRLNGDIDCVEAGAATAIPTGDGGPQVRIGLKAGCVHTMPGVESQEQGRASVMDAASGAPLSGATVDAAAQGPGLIEPAASAVTGANGDALLIFPINRFGEYVIEIVRVTLADGQVASFAPDSVLTVTHEVAAQCTPP
jgi:hypothetical protein